MNNNNEKQVDLNKIPRHVAIIMDGNGRWAKQSGKPRIKGHQRGLESVKETIKAAKKLKIQYLTLYVFSIENWMRPEEEISFLMNLLSSGLTKEYQNLIKNDISIKVLGNVTQLPKALQNKITDLVNKTADKKSLIIYLAISYSGKWEIAQTCKKIIEKVLNNELKISEINEDKFQAELLTADVPNPELLIRTGGEYRISNFLLWQLAYSELYFTSTFWPDFKQEDFYKAILDYQNRERRFGKTSDQIT
ncbi:MAG: isoprenyl transferase [Solitalea-like symbiont of Tyrophagus putrescentiae]